MSNEHPYDDAKFAEFYGLRTVDGSDLDLPEHATGGYDTGYVTALIAATGTPPEGGLPTEKKEDSA